LVTEAPDDARFNAKGLSTILATVPPWAPGLPLAAKGYENHRYKKG
jgi:DNA polymerase bacteriophage-type